MTEPHGPSAQSSVDYDRIASGYDQRRREADFSPINAAVHRLAERIDATRVLDLGCGTGGSLEGVPVAGGGLAVGLDLSAGMLQVARKRNPGY